MNLRFLTCIAALLLFAPLPASAQNGTTRIAVPSEKFAISPGGVDLMTGQYQVNETDLVIGGEPTAGGLVLTRTAMADVPQHQNPFGNMSHNWDISVKELTVSLATGQSPGSDFRITVFIDGRTDSFDSAGTDSAASLVSQGRFGTLTWNGNRGTAGVVYTYTGADGTIVTFRPMDGPDCSNYGRCASVASLVRADGTRFAFDYVAETTAGLGTAMRLFRVISSRGYALLLEGAGGLVTKACVLNRAYRALPANHVCPADAHGTANYTYSATGQTLASVTGPGNDTAQFTYATNEMRFIKPGHTTPWLVNQVFGGVNERGVRVEGVPQQTFADGQHYTYSSGYTDAGGNTWEFELGTYPHPYNHVCNSPPCSISDPEPINDEIIQTTSGPTKITDPLGRETTMNYCAEIPNQGAACFVTVLQSFTDPEGIRTHLKYDNNRNILEAKRVPKPGSTAPDGTPLQPIVTSSTFQYGPTAAKFANKPLTVTDGRNNVTTYTYSSDHGGALTETGPAVNGVSPQKRYSYAQRRAWVSNGAGGYEATTTLQQASWLLIGESYCREGAPAASGPGCATASDEVVTLYDYGPDEGPNNLMLRGMTVTASPGPGLANVTMRTCYAYDERGNRISESQPRSDVTSCAGVPPIAPLPFTTSYRYDVENHQTGIISPDPDGSGPIRFAAVRNTWDPAGRLTKVETGELENWQGHLVAPDSWGNFTVFTTLHTVYDALDRKVKESLVNGAVTASVTEYRYDNLGHLLCTAVRMNPTVYTAPTTPPGDACVAGNSATYGPDRVTKNFYDAAGQLIQVREAVGTSVEAAEATYSYTANGQKRYVIDAEGNRAELVYDGHDRLSRWVFPGTTGPSSFNDSSQATALATAGSVNAADYEGYEYDPNGNRTKLRKRSEAGQTPGSQTIAFTYDPLNRMTQKGVPASLTGASGYSVHYGYDLRGLQTFARFGSTTGQGVHTSYDGFGRIRTSGSDMGGVDRTFESRYDPGSNRTQFYLSGQYDPGFTYDGLNRPVSVQEDGFAGPFIHRFAYDRQGRLANPLIGVNAVATTVYTYEGGLPRLSALTHGFTGESVTFGFGYNAASQIVSASLSNNNFAWSGAANVNRDYARNGLNQYTGTSSGGMPSATIAYDANGNLTSESVIDANGNPQTTNYVYDLENRLVSAAGGRTASLAYDPLGRLWQTSGGSAGITRFVYDGDQLIAEYDGAGNRLRVYVHGARTDDPVAWYEFQGGPVRRYLHANHQGSIVAISDENGNRIATNSYDEYGIPAQSNEGRFQYTGQAWIPELRLYYYKARFYSPTLGRFMQTDPIGYDDQINLYAYVGNDPVNAADPMGTVGERALCPGNDPMCTNPAVKAPLSPAEAKEQREIADEVTSGASDILGTITESISDFSLPEVLSNASTFAEIGAEGEATALATLVESGYEVLETQLFIKTAAGIRVSDFLVSNPAGDHFLIEIKANSGSRSFLQARKDHLIQEHGGRIKSKGRNTVNYNQRIWAPTLVLNVRVGRK